MSVKTVLFDLDGTLINSLPLIRLTFKKVFADFGIPWANGEVLKTIGLPLREVAEYYMPGRTLSRFHCGYLGGVFSYAKWPLKRGEYSINRDWLGKSK